MICPNCGTNNEATYQFCMKCGTSLTGVAATAFKPDVPFEQMTPPPLQPAVKPVRAYSRRKDLLKEKITPADGEVSVRTYYCTYYQSKLLGLEASGYLGVTNKRVIFQALGTSNAGSSVIQSEVPIADVSGISSYKGTYFSLGHILAAVFAALITSGITTSIVTILGGLVGYASKSVEVVGAIGWLLAIGAFLLTFGFARDTIWKPVLATTSSAAFTVAGGGSLLSGFSRSLSSFGQNQSGGGLAGLGFFLAFLVGIYALFCIFWYARRPTFSLAVNSKGGSSTPISISGANGIGLFDVSAGKALAAEPADDSESMLEELGAVILDIQMLGDLGINKWKSL